MINFCPPEVLKLILAKLEGNDAYACMMVCKSWYSVSSTFYYERLQWEPTYTEKHVQLVSTTRMDGSTLGEYVKQLHFGEYREFTKDQFTTLISNLPNLKRIIISSGFIEYLPDIPDNQLKCIEEISKARDETPLQDTCIHICINMRLKNQIISLKLSELDISRFIVVSRDLLPVLSYFKRLSQLTIQTSDNEQAFIHPSSILNHCSNLVSLNFISDCNWILDTTENVLQTNLYSIKLNIPFFTQQHMEYFMQCLPNVKEFELEVDGQYFEQMVAAVRPATLKKFAKYLGQMEYLLILNDEYSGSFDIPPNIVTIVVQTFWKFMRDVCDKECFCDLTIHTDYLSPLGAIIKKKKQMLTMEISIHDDNNGFDVKQLDFCTYKSLEIQGFEENAPNNYPLYTNLLRPFIQLLTQQKNRQICSIKISMHPRNSNLKDQHLIQT